MEKCLRVIDKINEYAGVGFSYLLPSLVLVVVWQVISRYIFRTPSQWTFEMTNFLCGGLSLLGIAFCILHEQHVRVDVLWGKFSERGKAVADLVTFVFFLVFAVMLFWKGLEATQAALERPWETTITPWAPVTWPIKMTIPIGAFLAILQGVAKFIRDLRLAATGKGGA